MEEAWFSKVAKLWFLNFLDSVIEIRNEEENKFLTSYNFEIKYLNYVDNIPHSITKSEKIELKDDIKQILIIDNQDDDIYKVIEGYINCIFPQAKIKMVNNGETAVGLMGKNIFFDIIFVRSFYEAKLWYGKDVIHNIRKLEKKMKMHSSLIVGILDQNIKIDFIKYTNEGCDLILYSPLPQKETFKRKLFSAYHNKNKIIVI